MGKNNKADTDTKNDINIQMPTHMSRHILYFKIVVKMLEHLYLFV